MKIVQRKIADLVPYARNSRTHSAEQLNQLVASIKEFGFTNPVLLDGKNGILAGHGRVMAAQKAGLKQVPCIDLAHLTAEQRKAYVVADNRIALSAGWDFDILRSELADLKEAGFGLDVLGFDRIELEDLFSDSKGGGTETDPDVVPAPPVKPVSETGDVWILGAHRIMCGDSTNPIQVEKLMAGETAGLMHADPPYGMGKETDGVANDNLRGDELDAFQMLWWQAFRPHLEPNASGYIWGNAPDLWRLWYVGGLGESEPLTLRNEICWDKNDIAGMASPDLTQYPEASERCLFFQLGHHVFLVNQTKADYWPGWEPIRTWLVAQRELAGFTGKRVREICGNHMYGHWFGTSQWCLISEQNYALLAAAADGKAFTRPYAELRDEYEQMLAEFNGEIRGPRRAEFNAARPFFDNAHDVMRDVWPFRRVIGEERHGHATPKPVVMLERVMKSSLRAGELCAEPFAGSGSTIMAAETSGRRCYAMELLAPYVDVTVRRWQNFTGKEATLGGDGRTFAEICEARYAAKGSGENAAGSYEAAIGAMR